MEYITKAPLGAALLDEEKPGWAAEIDTAILNIASIYDCVLGQLYGDYGRGMQALSGNRLSNRSMNYGFDGTDHRQLTAEWRALIAERTAEKEEGTG